MPVENWLTRPVSSAGARKLLGQLSVIDVELYYLVEADVRRAAFSMAATRDASVLLRIKREIAAFAKAGLTETEFALWLETEGVAWSQSYSRLVYRNAVQNSYNLSRWRIQQRDGNKKRYPALLYDAVMDGQQTEFCDSHDGRWWWRRDFPRSLYPPNHHNCRSVVRAIGRKRATGMRDQRAVGLVGDEPPDWAGAPPNGWTIALRRRLRILEAKLGAASKEAA